MKNSALMLGFFILILQIGPVIAASVPDGKIIVRVEDGASSRCISSTSDRISMHLRRIIIKRDVGFFTEDKTAGIVIGTVISGEESTLSQKKVSFPRMYTANVSPYAKGNVSLPVEEKLFNRFSLAGSGNTYDSAEIEFTILAKKGKAPFGVALAALADISKNLPTPINPFSDGFKYFSDYANKVVDGSLNEENNVGQQSKEGKIVLSFSSTGTCTGDQEKTGTLAVVSGSNGIESEGYLDIKKSYCWSAVLRPIFTLKFAAKPNSGACTSVAEGEYATVNNPYIAFFLNAEPQGLTSSQRLEQQALILPKRDTARIDVSSDEVEKSILSTYGFSSNSDAIQKDVQYIADSTNNVLNETAVFSPMLKPNKSGISTLSITARDSVALDLAESIKRCLANGVETTDCL